MLNFFRKTTETKGWRAVHFAEDEVRACHIERPPSGKPIVVMAASEALNGETHAAALARLARDWQGRAWACTTALDAANYHFLPVEAPNVPAAELKAAISWTVTDMIDFRNDEATIDVLSIPGPKDGAQRARPMYAVVARTELANEMHRRFESAKLPLQAIDVPEMAQRNLAALLERDARAIALISFDAKGSLLTFSAGGELLLARRINVAAAELAVDDAARRIDTQERVALEVQRSLDHFQRQFAWLGLAGLAVAPIGDDDRGLIAALRDNLDIGVEPLALDQALDLSRTPQLLAPAMQSRFLMPLGLALRHEETVL